MILVWKLEVLSKGPYLRPVHCTRCARSCSCGYLPEPCLTVASLFPRGLFVSAHVVLSSRIAKMHCPRRPESLTLPVHCWKANREAQNDTIGVISGIWFNTVFIRLNAGALKFKPFRGRRLFESGVYFKSHFLNNVNIMWNKKLSKVLMSRFFAEMAHAYIAYIREYPPPPPPRSEITC